MGYKRVRRRKENKDAFRYHKKSEDRKGDFGKDLRRWRKGDKSQKRRDRELDDAINRIIDVNGLTENDLKELDGLSPEEILEELIDMTYENDMDKRVENATYEEPIEPENPIESEEPEEIIEPEPEEEVTSTSEEPKKEEPEEEEEHPESIFYEDNIADEFIKNFVKLSTTDPVELIKAIFPKYAGGGSEGKEPGEEGKNNGESGPNEPTDKNKDGHEAENSSDEDIDTLIDSIAKQFEEEMKDDPNSKRYIEKLSALKRLKYFLKNLDIDEIFIGKEKFYGAIAFTMKDNDLTLVENFLDRDGTKNVKESYGYATYLISRNHMFELLAQTRTNVLKESEKYGYRCERIAHSNENYYDRFENTLHQLKHTRDVINYTSIDPLKHFNPTLEEFERGKELCARYKEGYFNNTLDDEEAEYLMREIDEIYDRCIKRREAYSRKNLEVIGR